MGRDGNGDRRILVVEDEAELARLVEIHLRDQGWDVSVAPDGRSGLELAAHCAYDLLILDLMLPDIDGLEVCRRLRARQNGTASYLPILMLTARSSEVDRVVGLELGADDYLVKPFSVRELVARVKAILRRVDALERQPNGALEVGDLRIDVERREARAGGNLLSLTAKEFDLLAFFAAHPGRVFSRGELLDQVWGHAHDGYEHTVNTHINRLRGKLESDPQHPSYIVTVWGVGYKLADPRKGGNE